MLIFHLLTWSKNYISQYFLKFFQNVLFGSVLQHFQNDLCFVSRLASNKSSISQGQDSFGDTQHVKETILTERFCDFLTHPSNQSRISLRIEKIIAGVLRGPQVYIRKARWHFTHDGALELLW